MYINRFFFIGCFLISPICSAQIFNSVVQKKHLQVVEVAKPSMGKILDNDDSTVIDSTRLFLGKKTMFSLPLKDIYITSLYGYRRDPFSGKKKYHQGVDFRAANDSVFSIMPGVVSKVGNDRKLGIYVDIDHGIYSTTYGHLSAALVEENQFIHAGQLIAYTGNTGRSTANHLHLALKKNKKFIDPLPYIKSINELLLSVK